MQVLAHHIESGLETVMTEAKLRDAIDRVLEQVTFEPPITTAYCADVYRAIHAILPKETLVDVYFRRPAVGADVLVIDASCGGAMHKLEITLEL